ncbi:hypothetical protein Vretimale_1546 [Volvox reticuliferus]|uniref:EKC/KEOPS complex subunit cgi121 n=1 Tax=Volvox reticuliferus TaxID=1737510 RepID=A0A8J4D7Y6_9CHLO|nr:hypothetical protein Vretifemale_10908 [Volvox reticuliferus]GIL95535.1 hypothetical protein Vretimale_1546 [Volvox reticuliferus]
MSQSVLEFETFPGRTLTLALFKNCKNSKDVRAAIRDPTMTEFAYINAALIVDPFLVHLAGYRALAAESSGRLNSKSLHTELIYDISGTRHVAESLKRFGITDECKSLLVARFDCKPEELAALKSRIQGEEVPLSELASLADLNLIDKYYKLTKAELQVRSRADAAAFRIGAKDFL